MHVQFSTAYLQLRKVKMHKAFVKACVEGYAYLLDMLTPYTVATCRNYTRIGLGPKSYLGARPGLEVVKVEYNLKLKIRRNDWLLSDTCPQAANHCALF